MSSIFDLVRVEEDFLKNLEGDLKEVFHCISHDDKYENQEWIVEQQKRISGKYGEKFDYLWEKGIIDSYGPAGGWIVCAYSGFLDLLNHHYDSSEDLRVEAEDILMENLELPNPLDLDEEDRKKLLRVGS
ncbi:hypothetical protein HOD29_04845 [archaeon]|jgi:hypothetical protein|nr:hypothetical protein [archaeon]